MQSERLSGIAPPRPAGPSEAPANHNRVRIVCIGKMIQRGCKIGFLGLGLLLLGTQSTTGQRIIDSAQHFRQYFHDLKGAGNSLNPVERFMFSLALANTDRSEKAR